MILISFEKMKNILTLKYPGKFVFLSAQVSQGKKRGFSAHKILAKIFQIIALSGIFILLLYGTYNVLYEDNSLLSENIFVIQKLTIRINCKKQN